MAVALVGQATNSNTTGTTLQVTRTTTAGNLLVLCCSWAAGSTVEATVADSGGVNTWIKGAWGSKTGSVGTRTEIWYVLNAAAITSVTITTPTFAHGGNLSEWSGVASFDVGSQSTVGGTSTAPTSPTITPTTGDLIIAGENHANATDSTSTYGTALTKAGVTSGGKCHPRYFLSGTTSEAGVWTITSAVWGACIASFKATAATVTTTFHLTDTASDINPGAEAERLASLSYGATPVTGDATSTVTGPTAGIQANVKGAATPVTWFTNPLNAVTIAGTISINLWMDESTGGANVGAQLKVEWYDGAGTTLNGTVLNSEQGSELAVGGLVVVTWTASPTSSALAAGDRLKITVLGNDAGGTMATGLTFRVGYGADISNAGFSGDTWVGFTETITEYVAPAFVPYRNPMPPLIAQ